MIVYRLNDHEGPGGLVVTDPADLLPEIESAGAGCAPGTDGPHWFVYIEEMSQERLDSLEEFDGF